MISLRSADGYKIMDIKYFYNLASSYSFKVSYRNTRTTCKIDPDLTIKTTYEKFWHKFEAIHFGMVLGIIIETVTVNLVVDICSVNSLNIIATDGMLP